MQIISAVLVAMSKASYWYLECSRMTVNLNNSLAVDRSAWLLPQTLKKAHNVSVIKNLPLALFIYFSPLSYEVSTNYLCYYDWVIQRIEGHTNRLKLWLSQLLKVITKVTDRVEVWNYTPKPLCVLSLFNQRRQIIS